MPARQAGSSAAASRQLRGCLHAAACAWRLLARGTT
jgi:hypothetical protein